METATQDAERVWKAFRGVCNALRTAVKAADRVAAVANAEAFMAIPANRKRVHKWRGWGLLFAGLISVVRAEICGYMNVDPLTGSTVVSKKRKVKTGATTKSKPPKLNWWANLRNEFANVHLLDGPMLHLDPNGRDCIAQLFDFALLVVNRGDGAELDANVRRVMGDLERAAWQSIELIVGYRVYCAVLEKRQLQEAIELALAAIDHGAVAHSAFPGPGSTDLMLLASSIHLVLQHAPYDLHDWLPMLVPFLSSWFGTINEAADSRSAQADVAPNMIEIVTGLGRKFFTFIGPLLLRHGNPMLQYVKRSFKYARQRQRAQLAEFVSLYVQLFEYHADSLQLHGDLDPTRLRRDAKALQAIFLDPVMLQSLPVSSHASANTGGAASAAMSGLSEGATVALEPFAATMFKCAADIIFFHDRLLQRIVESSKNTKPDDEDDADNDVVPPSPAKRSFDSTMPMAWEQLLHQILSNDQSDDSSSASSSTPLSQLREQFVHQAQHQKQARMLQRRQVANLLVLVSVLRRHGRFYVDGRIGDLVGIMEFVTHTLQSKEVGKLQYLALHLLWQLAMFSPLHHDLKGELFEEYWDKVWKTLLRPESQYSSDLHVVVVRNSVSDLVFNVLNCCVCFRLVNRGSMLSASSQLWSIYTSKSSTPVTYRLGSTSISPGSIGFLCCLFQHMQPSSDGELRQDDRGSQQDGEVQSVRSKVLSSIFEHIQSLVLFEESKPMDASWEDHFSPQDANPVVIGIALLNFLGIPPQPILSNAFMCRQMEPSLLQALSVAGDFKGDGGVGEELDGFGVHFSLQEWGLAWLQDTSSFLVSDGHAHPDRFSSLVEFAQLTGAVCKPTRQRREEWEISNGLSPLHIPLRLSRRSVTDWAHSPASVIRRLVYSVGEREDVLATASIDAVEASKLEILAKLNQLVDDLSGKISSVETDSPKLFCYFKSVMMVALTLASAYGQTKDAAALDSRDDHKDKLNSICMLLQKSLMVLASHFTAATIDQARQSTMATTILTQLIVDFQSFILIVQGTSSLVNVNHPCADPIDLRIPSELRPAIRKIVAAVEASLELMMIDDGSGNGHSNSSQTSAAMSREDITMTSRSFSSANIGSAGCGSWDWESHQSQSKSTRAILSTTVDVDDDDLCNPVVPTSKPTFRATHATKILSLWSLRIILLLKKESGVKAVRKYVLELEFTPDFLVAVASMLCGICGCESLEVIAKILEAVDEEVARGIRRGGSNGNPIAASILDADILGVLRRCALMHERRKQFHKEEVPELLLSTARTLINVGRQLSVRDQLLAVRCAELATLEVFFRLDADAFSDFIDTTMTSLQDTVMVVRFAAVRACQTLFYMYPDGGDQVFRDVFEVLSQCLPPSVRTLDGKSGRTIPSDYSCTAESCVVAIATLYVCACSNPSVVPKVLLIFMRLAVSKNAELCSRTDLLRDWLSEIAEWYNYPSVGRMVSDHFSFLWSHHLKIAAGGVSFFATEEQRKQITEAGHVDAKDLLDSFPTMLLFDRTTEAIPTAPAGILSAHIDMIMPSAMVYDVVNDRGATDSTGFPLIHELAWRLLYSYSESRSELPDSRKNQLSTFVQEQLITDLFALAFVLESASSSSVDGAAVEAIGAQMLSIAEDRASTYSLTLSHLGHVVMKMVRFSVWDIVGSIHAPALESSSLLSGGELWVHAMKAMKEKYSGFDWGRMNLAELLSEFHELLLQTANFEPLASCAVECLCVFVTEVKDAISDSNVPNSAVFQHLLLHVLFETVKIVKRRSKHASRKLALTIRDICDHFMKNCTEAFGKYLNFVVREIAVILVCSSQATDSTTLDSDDKANFEWVIFAICNNMATGLGKFMVDVELVPNGVSGCLDRLNSILLTSTGKTSRDSSTDRRKSLENSKSDSLAPTSADKETQTAINEIERFVQRANQVGERFYQPRTFAIGNGEATDRHKIESNSAAGVGSQLQLLCDHIRTLQEGIRIRPGEDVTSEDKTETAAANKAVLAKLTRTLFNLSTQCGSAQLDVPNSVLLTLADTLGKVGAWDTSDFDLSPGQNDQELNRLYQRHFRRGSLRETKSTFQMEMYEHVLRYLSSVMFESGTNGHVSSEIIHDALNAIKKVLRLDEGVKALARSKDQELKLFLEAFVQTSSSKWSLASSFVVETGSQSTALNLSNLRALWRAHKSISFDRWIGPLTEAMAELSIDRVLRACAPMARVRTDLAIFMFPYVLWAILKNSRREPKIATIVNECIREIVSSSSADVPEGRVVQIIVHTVNFLRETEKALFIETNGQRVNGKVATPSKRASANATTSPAQLNQGRNAGATETTNSANRLAYSCLVDVDLLELAEAAIRVKMPFSAMQYVEMWLEDHHGGSLPSLSSSTAAMSAINDDDRNVRRILVDAYNLDDDADGIYGVNDGRTFDSQMVAYNREGNYAQVLPLYDVALQFDRGSSNMQILEGSLNALNHLGYEHMLLRRLQAIAGKGPNTPNIQEHRFELAWKSLQWDSVEGGGFSTFTGSSQLDGKVSPYMHQRTVYHSLKALAHKDTRQVKQLTASAKQQILMTAQTSLFGLECTQESIEALVHLQSINEIEECAAAMEEGNVSKLPRLFVQWRTKHCAQSKSMFDANHGLIALEEVLAQLVDLPERANTLASTYLSLSTLSRQAGRLAVAYKAHMRLEELHSRGELRVLDEANWKMERAKLLWSQRETRSAIWVAKQLQSELEARIHQEDQHVDSSLKMLYVASLTMTGKWIASQRSENSQVIIQDYLQKAADVVDAMSGNELHETPSDAQHAARAHVALAEYMAEMYQQVAARVNSREWLAGKRVAEARQRELAECLAMNEAKQHDNRAHIHALNKEVQYDYEERTKIEASVDQFLGGALRSFGRALVLSAKSELAVVFRVLSLWFSNQLKPSVNRILKEIVDSVPSYKFVPLSYQIISRVGSSLSSGQSTRTDSDDAALFERVLSAMVIKLCEQHPHHALVQLVALKNSGDVEGKGAVEFRTNVGDAKSEGAKKYIEKLRKGTQRELLESLDVLSNAYIQLALFDTREYHKLGKKIPLGDVKISTLGGNMIPFDQCLRERSRRTGAASGANRAATPAVLTSSISPRPDMDYSGVSRMLSFDPMFSITDSGIHRPKIIYCFGSDGRRFKQLVKGKDDIRQDLVIEQVFDTVNQFLKDDSNTRKRNLRLRTYKVVPLSPIAGVLEWVDSTIPWGAYLVSRTGKRLSAHERYHPHEWKHIDCRTYLKNQPDKYAAFQTIQANFTPVFHHFFLEKFPDAAMWYKRRLSYVQSAAVTSIVGYILGIGDRHSQNILIHEETAELVHIDFGVVFDQGMALFTPETVPFRLTRDLVDGMGVSGVDGVFTRCCEATLQLLRKKSASVVTILEVFVHDPLYRWTLSPLKALKIQEEGNTTSVTGSRSSETDDDSSAGGVAGANNDAAARALIRVKQKLEGYEDPNGNALSIEGQVKQLISAAQDPRNLCALFPGWAPWL